MPTNNQWSYYEVHGVNDLICCGQLDKIMHFWASAVETPYESMLYVGVWHFAIVLNKSGKSNFAKPTKP